MSTMTKTHPAPEPPAATDPYPKPGAILWQGWTAPARHVTVRTGADGNVVVTTSTGGPGAPTGDGQVSMSRYGRKLRTAPLAWNAAPLPAPASVAPPVRAARASTTPAPAPAPAVPPAPPAARAVPVAILRGTGGWPAVLAELARRGQLAPSRGSELAPVREQLGPLVAQAQTAAPEATITVPAALAATLREWASVIERARLSGALVGGLDQQLQAKAAADWWLADGNE